MSNITLQDLQFRIQDKNYLRKLDDFYTLCDSFLAFIYHQPPTRITSPNRHHYIFYQFDQLHGYRITRPLNTNLFIDRPDQFQEEQKRFTDFLGKLANARHHAINQPDIQTYIQSRGIHKVIYTIQQAIGCIGDSLTNTNQSRKRIGQLFEIFIRLIIQKLGLHCESRTLTIRLPDYPEYEMSYELDMVFSQGRAIIVSETRTLHEKEIVASVKTTSKDRLDKIFLDKYLLSKLLGRDIPVIAIFLHDVQRSRIGNNSFGISSTFKSNHFLSYTVALNRLEGVYYIDPPEHLIGRQFDEQIKEFQTFLVSDLWTLSS
jgi:hypothetical protein